MDNTDSRFFNRVAFLTSYIFRIATGHIVRSIEYCSIRFSLIQNNVQFFTSVSNFLLKFLIL